MKPAQLRELIRITLDFLGPQLNGEAAVELLLGTAAQESGDGEFIFQVGGGPALGVWQMEPATHDDIWQNYLAYRKDLSARMERLVLDAFPKASQMSGNIFYACAMARVQYLRSPLPLPAAGDLKGQAELYKQVYNTPGGAATIDEYLKNAKVALA